MPASFSPPSQARSFCFLLLLFVFVLFAFAWLSGLSCRPCMLPSSPLVFGARFACCPLLRARRCPCFALRFLVSGLRGLEPAAAAAAAHSLLLPALVSRVSVGFAWFLVPALPWPSLMLASWGLLAALACPSLAHPGGSLDFALAVCFACLLCLLFFCFSRLVFWFCYASWFWFVAFLRCLFVRACVLSVLLVFGSRRCVRLRRFRLLGLRRLLAALACPPPSRPPVFGGVPRVRGLLCLHLLCSVRNSYTLDARRGRRI
jgi:hypothetical protein